jgi:hypothetical protein
MRFLLFIALGIAVALMVYVRFAPINSQDWGRPDIATKPVGDYAGEKTFHAVRVVDGPEVLTQLRAVALAQPRTSEIDGANWITFVTRTQVMGYPDFTSARVVDVDGQQLLQIYARSRFGKYDLGVNKARVLDWLSQLDLLTPEG